MVDVCGPFAVYCKPKSSRPMTRDGIKRNREKIKLYVFMAVDMFSHRVETAVMDSMQTSSLTSALHQIMQNNGWRTFHLSLDPGSSLIPAAENTVTELRQLEEEEQEESAETEEMDPALAAEVVQSLRNSGFQIRTPHAKASWRQANVESSI